MKAIKAFESPGVIRVIILLGLLGLLKLLYSPHGYELLGLKE